VPLMIPTSFGTFHDIQAVKEISHWANDDAVPSNTTHLRPPLLSLSIARAGDRIPDVGLVTTTMMLISCRFRLSGRGHRVAWPV
jgi:hypothetical protein